MTLFAKILGYFTVAAVMAILATKFENIAYKYDYDDATRPSFAANFMAAMLWPVTIWFFITDYVPSIKPLYDHVKVVKAHKAEQQSEQLRLEKRKALIRSINADIDRLEPTRRKDVLSGRPIIDARSENDQKLCYVCNKPYSPYTSDYAGKLINTVSGVPAHEECLMSDL